MYVSLSSSIHFIPCVATAWLMHPDGVGWYLMLTSALVFNELRVFLQVWKLSGGNFTCMQATFPEIQSPSIYSSVLFTVHAIFSPLKKSAFTVFLVPRVWSQCLLWTSVLIFYFFLVKNCFTASLVMSEHVRLAQDHHLGYDLLFVITGVLNYDSIHWPAGFNYETSVNLVFVKEDVSIMNFFCCS